VYLRDCKEFILAEAQGMYRKRDQKGNEIEDSVRVTS
jgi:hypothetical protein